MKTRFQKLTLTLLIAVLCINCVIPVFAAESFNDREKQFLEESVASSKKIFSQLYAQLLKEHKLYAKLVKIIDSCVDDEKMNSMVWVVHNIQTLINNAKITGEIQGMVIKQFSPEYEEFLRDLEKRFGEENNKEIAIFYENLADEAVARNEDPAIQDYLRKTKDKYLKEDAKVLQAQIAKSLRKKHLGENIKVGTAEIGITTPTFNQQVNLAILEENDPSTMSDIAAALEKGIAITSLPITGAILSVWNVGSILKSFLDSPETDALKTKLKTGLFENLEMRVPANYWELMEKDVRVIFGETAEVFGLNLDEAIDSAVDPEVKALIKRRVRENSK